MSKIYFVLFRILISSISYAGDFSDALLDGKLSDSLLSPECKERLIDFYRNGNKLELKSVRDSLITFSEWVKIHPRIDDKYMYHYTSYLPTIDNAKANDMEAVFSSLKMRSEALEVSGNSSGVLWAAGDPTSSRSFGNTLLKLEIDQNSKIFRYHLFDDDAFRPLLHQELQESYPVIYKDCRRSRFQYFYLEDSGVRIIFKSGTDFSWLWFTILTSKAILDVKVSSKLD
jgi:hypothetical protein